MYFGIRGKVALLVMVATAASALLVAKVLSTRATDVLRSHELVDLGDEAELRGWEITDQIEGLRDDLVNLALEPDLQQRIVDGDPREELLATARSLCRRYWTRHLRVDVVRFGENETETILVAEKAEIESEDLWFPGPDAQAGSRLHISPIQRVRVVRTDLPGASPVERWEPVIWAVAPLDPLGNSPDLEGTFIRILMTLHDTRSPRHLFVLENEDGVQLVRHDESASLERGNDAVFDKLSEDPLLLSALEQRRSLDSTPEEPQEEPKVDRLVRKENVALESPYYFQEGKPGKQLADAINFESDAALTAFIEQVQAEVGDLGIVGGIRSGVREIRMLAQSPEDLEQLRALVIAALSDYFSKAFDGIDWRNVVECDEIHSWSVRLLVGNGENQSEYLIHYAVLDDELASSIDYEMKSLRNVALLVAGGFGFLGFLIAMHFIRPLKEMTRTAQKLTDSNPDGLYKQVAGLAQRLDIKRRDEVGDIARASKRLFEELVAFQAELEHRVNDRTQELRMTNTELEKANDKLKSLSHEKDAFVAKVSHDLRQPLNAIFLQVETLKLSDLDDGQKRDVQRIRDHAARELNLVNDILEYQKIIMGAETLSKDIVDVRALLEELADGFRPSLADKPVTLAQRSEDDIGTVTADDRRLRQVLGNLLGNACKFTREGSIVLEARAREIEGEDWVEFTVTDTGRGMSPEEQSRVFVPFVSNKKDNAGGSGLGLSICRELVTQMGGRIGFVSEFGKGTHFSVFIPREPTSRHYERAEESPDPDAFSAGETMAGISEHLPREGTILVVEDDEKTRTLLERILKDDGYRVITAENGDAGVKMAKEHQPDAITLDVVMPGDRNGWEVLSELKNSPATQAIPVIIVSVMAEQEHGLALEVEDYLVKPVDADRLGRVVARVTSHAPQRNLLLVDDDEASLESMARVLDAAGWQTILARDGAEALATLEKTRPAAIVLDLLMPEMDGFEFLQHIQRHDHLSTIPVIVMTGKDPSETERKFLRDRVTTVLEKGRHSARDLLESINSRLRSP
ncbi:MAG: response regulator [Verrucomicrobiales bacterium]